MAITYYHARPGDSVAAAQWTGVTSAISDIVGTGKFLVDSDNNLTYSDPQTMNLRTVAFNGWIVQTPNGYIPMSNDLFASLYDKGRAISGGVGLFVLSGQNATLTHP